MRLCSQAGVHFVLYIIHIFFPPRRDFLDFIHKLFYYRTPWRDLSLCERGKKKVETAMSDPAIRARVFMKKGAPGREAHTDLARAPTGTPVRDVASIPTTTDVRE
jgi:hypothetical protein